MASSIDPTKPTSGTALTADVRANFSSAKDEIEALQTADIELLDGTSTIPDWHTKTTATYASATTFTVPDVTSFHSGRRVKTSEGAYGVITGVSGTTITVELSSGSLTASLASVQLGPAADGTSSSVQYYQHKDGEIGVVNYQIPYNNVLRFIPQNLHLKIWLGTNTTLLTNYLQNALDSAEGNIFAVSKVTLPAGTYLTDTLYVPLGLWFDGEGHTETTGRTVTKLVQSSSGNNDVLRFKSLSGGSLFYWYGRITNISIFGDPTATAGFGIHTKDSAGNDVIFQDTTVIRDLTIRRMPQGGINCTSGAFPLTIGPMKLLFNNGPGITCKRITQYQGIHFLDVSGDGNNGGLIKLDTLNDGNSNVTITNLKSEARVNADYGSAEHQLNAIVLSNCDGLPITINGATHTSSIPDGAYYKKPGDLVQVTGNTPSLSWSAVGIRVRSTDTGSDPYIIGGVSGINAPNYKITHGLLNVQFQLYNSIVILQRGNNSDGDVTPSVKNMQSILLTNSAATTITDFDNGTDSQLLIVSFQDANTTISSNANILLQGSSAFTGSTNDTLTLMKVATSWREIARSVN